MWVMPARRSRLATWTIALAGTFVLTALARADEFAFPNTDAGAHAREWFAANAAGETAMRAFWRQHGDAASLAAHPVDEQVGMWKRIRGQLGAAVPLRIESQAVDRIVVRARDGGGMEILVSFECANRPPHGVLGMRIEPAGGPGGMRRPGVPPPGGEPAGPPPGDGEIVAGLALALDSLSQAGRFSGVAMLVKDDTALFERAFGLASREHNVPNQLDTRFNLGSINKIFTKVAILQLAEARKLDLDATIDRYLPDYPADKASKITVRQLLDHRGGVPDVFGPGYQRAGRQNLRTTADWYALVRDEPLLFAPGTRQRYSNGGFVLLGAIVERLSGETYYDYVRRHIYQPAGMTRTDHLLATTSDPARATAYTGGGEGSAPSIAELPARGSSAGGGYSTAGDLVRFARALRAGRLIRGTLAPELVGPHSALGIAGGSPGVNGLLLSEGGYVLVVLANTDPPAAEQFIETTGRDLRRAAGAGDGGRGVIGAGSAH